MTGTQNEVVSSFGFNRTSIMQSGDGSVSVSANRNDHNRSSVVIPIISSAIFQAFPFRHSSHFQEIYQYKIF